MQLQASAPQLIEIEITLCALHLENIQKYIKSDSVFFLFFHQDAERIELASLNFILAKLQKSK